LKIILDGEKCTGHGRCYAMAPHLIEDDDRGFGAVISDGEVPEELRGEADRAVLACPENAISLVR
jgi:ferredoxin